MNRIATEGGHFEEPDTIDEPKNETKNSTQGAKQKKEKAPKTKEEKKIDREKKKIKDIYDCLMFS